jgi:prepilin-type N-terminal cleavage/methylation domain-containing protein
MNARNDFDNEHGFTLVELLLAIVVVGILTAVALVGIGGLTDTAKTATCQVTMDASRAAVISYYSKQNPHVYPATFDVMTSETPPDLVLQGEVQHPSPVTLSSGGSPTKWTITLDPATGTLAATGADASHCS